ncbi:hypothetical protein J1N35_033551 [Gossypium stocksii]|uniref:Uncharacterized protein n=1 Tax=Gossypium stocksii TaxID=47602 RepID=A0A9D3UQA0_9ROSI|nr:hypothetical protein J1N35_033551 [Gossypium stocksii]
MYLLAEENIGSIFPRSWFSFNPDQSHSITLLYNLSILKDKVQEAKSLISILIPPDQAQPESTSLAISSTASSNRCLLEQLQVTISTLNSNSSMFG